jgi:ribosomal protein S18 acetylase RimI-like enzyme
MGSRRRQARRNHAGVIRVRPVGPDDTQWSQQTLKREWGTVVARKGALVDVLTLDGLVAILDGEPAGLLTYHVQHHELEVVTLQADPQGSGIGRALMDAAHAHAETMEARRMWLVTTNDNFRAIGFYQRWGMDLLRLWRNGVDASRRAKPSIPLMGKDGIPLRHELEFELILER